MSATDPIASFLTRLRNASRARQERVTVPVSGLTLRILEIMKDERFVENFKLMEEGPKRSARVELRYFKDKKPAFRGIKRVSKPGRRCYVAADEVRRILGGMGISVLSTSRGIMTDNEARKQKVGGEVLCNIW